MTRNTFNEICPKEIHGATGYLHIRGKGVDNVKYVWTKHGVPISFFNTLAT
jgi:hypothetical protein